MYLTSPNHSFAEADFTKNPFASTNSLDTNPFEDPFTEQTPSYSHSATAAREAELAQRERDLEQRERELGQKAEYIRKHGRNNWPPCTLFLFTRVSCVSQLSYPLNILNACTSVYPLIFHSIAEEIPEDARPLITRLYQLWLVLIGTMVVNTIACIFVLTSGASDGGKDLGASIGYALHFISLRYV